MNRSYKKDLITSVVCSVAFALTVVACGGGHSDMLGSAGGSSSLARLVSKAIPGGSVLPSGNGNVIAFALFQTATAATATPQSFSGFCQGFSNTNTHADNIIYGLGFLVTSDCSTSATVPVAKDGAVVVDSGNLTNFIATADCTSAATDPNDGTLTLFVNGVNKGVIGHLGTSCVVKNKSLSIPVSDGDRVAVQFSQIAGQNFSFPARYQNLQIGFSKQ
jgi:hypothetical protein